MDQVLMGPRRVRAESVLFAAAAYFGVRTTELTGDARHRTLVRARAVSAYVMRELGFTIVEAAAVLQRDHTMVSVHSANIKGLIKDGDPLAIRDVTEVRKLVDGSSREIDELKAQVQALTERQGRLEKELAAVLDELRRGR